MLQTLHTQCSEEELSTLLVTLLILQSSTLCTFYTVTHHITLNATVKKLLNPTVYASI